MRPTTWTRASNGVRSRTTYMRSWQRRSVTRQRAIPPSQKLWTRSRTALRGTPRNRASKYSKCALCYPDRRRSACVTREASGGEPGGAVHQRKRRRNRRQSLPQPAAAGCCPLCVPRAFPHSLRGVLDPSTRLRPRDKRVRRQARWRHRLRWVRELRPGAGGSRLLGWGEAYDLLRYLPDPDHARSCPLVRLATGLRCGLVYQRVQARVFYSLRGAGRGGSPDLGLPLRPYLRTLFADCRLPWSPGTS